MKQIIGFIKRHRFDIIISGSVIAFLVDVYLGKHSFSFTIIFFYIFGYAIDSERGQTDIQERKKLRLRGLTPADLRNIKFVRNWEQIRKKGMIKYTLVDGGIFFGLALCFIISIAYFIIKKDAIKYLSADPTNMFSFIAYTYVAGMVGGAVIYRLIWAYNEEKFISLTDPIH